MATSIFLALGAILRGAAALSPGYPWAGSLESRSEEILSAMRDELTLTMDVSILPSNLAANPDSLLSLNNVFGEEYQCSMSKSSDSIPLHFFDPELLSHLLGSVCSDMTIDYWTYEWCHRRSISQFHIEQQKEMSVRRPLWSLGKYDRTEVVREGFDNSNMSAPIVKLIDYFEGGQPCDETQDHRHTEVVSCVFVHILVCVF
jgi:hypothetical protein